MKKIVAIILTTMILCIFFVSPCLALDKTATFGGVESNNFVDTSENGKWSSVGGSYLPRAKNVVGRWGIACIDSKTISGDWDDCTSVGAYLYTREDATRVTESVSLNVCKIHNETPDISRQFEFAKSSYAVPGRTYKTVGITHSSGMSVGPNRIYFHTVP